MTNLKSNLQDIWKALKHIGVRRVIIMILVILVSAGIVVCVAIIHYRSEKDTLFLRGELAAKESSEDLERYLMVNKNSLRLSGYVVNNMVRRQASSEEILQYITEESERMQETLYENFTGLYGWIDGEYLDGGGWVPEPDYDPLTRPWYVKALEGAGELIYVDPYTDQETGEVRMTMAELLDDGESVIALDLPLNDMQHITEAATQILPGSEAAVLDSSGGVVAHSVTQEIGRNYLQETDTLGHFVAEEIYQGDVQQFEIDFQGNTYVVYDEEIEGGWHCVSVINSAVFYNPLNKVLIIGVCMEVLIILIVLTLFIHLSRRNLRANDLNIRLSAVADIYTTIIDIDLEANTFAEITNKETFSEEISNQKDAQASLLRASASQASALSKSLLRSFLDLSTLRDRLGDRTNLSVEFLDQDTGWCRGQFIVAKKDDEGRVTRVLWAIENIDEEKKHRDHLVHLAETDQLTTLYNRTSGEQKIEELLEQGRGGMFALMDIDHFKSINDRFGHGTGDQVIVQVARCFRNAFRNQDIVLRLGGDEFAAFAPGVFDAETGNKILNRFFRYLEDISIEAMGDEPVCVSVGIAFSTQDAPESFRELYQAADQCAYESKKTPGNQVTYHTVRSS